MIEISELTWSRSCDCYVIEDEAYDENQFIMTPTISCLRALYYL